MTLPDGQPLLLNADVLYESSGDRLILWWPIGGAGSDQLWERIGTVARATVATENRICWVEVTSVPARQVRVGVFRKLRNKLTGADGDCLWTLPSGALAEPNGPRQTDLRLAWSQDAAIPLDESKIRAYWSDKCEIWSLGPNLFLVLGVVSHRVHAEATPNWSTLSQQSPRAIAQRALDLARAADDPVRVTTALGDLGLAMLVEGESSLAVAVLEEAHTEAQRLSHPDMVADAASNLASGLCTLGQSARARTLLISVLNHARIVGDRYAEKLALDRLARALAGLGDRAGALQHIERALAMATAMSDWRQVANLLWRAAVEHAELGHHDLAVARAEATVDLLRRLDHPTADWYAQHLANFQSQPTTLSQAPAYFGSINATTSLSPQTLAGPGILRMAATATKSMAKFIGSGFKATSAEAYRTRPTVCATCEHHTGVRCRICGCITAAKARMLHEKCPVGRWPA